MAMTGRMVDDHRAQVGVVWCRVRRPGLGEVASTVLTISSHSGFSHQAVMPAQSHRVERSRSMPSRRPRNFFSVNFHQAAASEVAELPFQVEIHLTGHPLFVAFGEQSGNKAQARSGVGEDRSDAGSALQFSVNSFEAIRCS